MSLVGRVWDFFWFGRLCPRCNQERTGHWGRWITGVPFDEWICMTCETVDRINFRARLEKWIP